jgi:hypothetical protein
MHGPMNVKFIVECFILLMIQSWQSANVEGAIKQIVINKTAYDYITIKLTSIAENLF